MRRRDRRKDSKRGSLLPEMPFCKRHRRKTTTAPHPNTCWSSWGTYRSQYSFISDDAITAQPNGLQSARKPWPNPNTSQFSCTREAHPRARKPSLATRLQGRAWLTRQASAVGLWAEALGSEEPEAAKRGGWESEENWRGGDAWSAMVRRKPVVFFILRAKAAGCCVPTAPTIGPAETTSPCRPDSAGTWA